jgi:hypothetical protein
VAHLGPIWAGGLRFALVAAGLPLHWRGRVGLGCTLVLFGCRSLPGLHCSVFSSTSSRSSQLGLPSIYRPCSGGSSGRWRPVVWGATGLTSNKGCLVLWSLPCQDEDLPIVSLHWSSWNVVFWKAPLANFDGRHAWSLPDRIEFGHTQPCFFLPFGFRGSDVKLCSLLPSLDMALVPWWS